MSKDNGTVTVGSLAAIVDAWKFVDLNVDTTNAVACGQTLTSIINDKDKLNQLWRVLLAFKPAAMELKTAEVGLGGKRAR